MEQHVAQGVSVIIPTLNRGQLLMRILTQIFEQETRTAYEIIVIDQTSQHEDEVQRFIDRIQNRIRYFRASYQSACRARNDGARKANYDVLLFLDDDVVPAHGFIDLHARHYRDVLVTAVTGPLIHEHTQYQEFSDLSPEIRERLLRRETMVWDARFQYDACQLNSCNFSVRRDWFFKVGGFDENFYGALDGDDFELAYRLIRHDARIIFAPEIPAIYDRSAPGGNRSFIGSAKVESSVFNHLYYRYKTGTHFPGMLSFGFALLRSNVLYKDAFRSGRVFNFFAAYLRGLVKFIRIGLFQKLPAKRLEPAAGSNA